MCIRDRSREDVTFITTKDLDAYKPYAQDMRYFHVIDYENDARYFGEIYCYDEDCLLYTSRCV